MTRAFPACPTMSGMDRVAGSSRVWRQRSFPVRLSSATMKVFAHHDGLAVRCGRGACAERVARLHVAGVFLPLEMAFVRHLLARGLFARAASRPSGRGKNDELHRRGRLLRAPAAPPAGSAAGGVSVVAAGASSGFAALIAVRMKTRSAHQIRAAKSARLDAHEAGQQPSVANIDL